MMIKPRPAATSPHSLRTPLLSWGLLVAAIALAVIGGSVFIWQKMIEERGQENQGRAALVTLAAAWEIGLSGEQFARLTMSIGAEPTIKKIAVIRLPDKRILHSSQNVDIGKRADSVLPRRIVNLLSDMDHQPNRFHLFKEDSSPGFWIVTESQAGTDYPPLPSRRVAIVGLIRDRALASESRWEGAVFAMSICSTLGTLLLLSYLFLNRLVLYPIARIQTTIDARRNGSTGIRSDLPRRDEIGVLAENLDKTLDEMATQSSRLLDTKRNLSVILEHTTSMVELTTPNGDLLLRSPLCERFSPDGLRVDLIAVSDSSDRPGSTDPEMRRVAHAISMAILNGSRERLDARLPDKAGNPCWFDIQVTGLRENDHHKVSKVLTVFRDITALKSSTELLRGILDTAPGVFTAYRPCGDMAIEFVSDNALQFTGYDTKQIQDYPGFWAHKIHPDDRTVVEKRNAALITEGSQVLEYRWLFADGEYRHLREHRRLIRDRNGQPSHVAAFAVDITGPRNVELQLRHSQKLEGIGQITGQLAHDFNNLLGIIVGNLDLLEDSGTCSDEKSLRRLEASKRASLRGAEVTRALLAVARREDVERERQDINHVIQEIFPLLESAVGKSVQIRSELASGTLYVIVETGAFFNAVLNLCVNARDALEGTDHDRLVTVRTRRLEIDHDSSFAMQNLSPGWYAVIEVVDNGAGMDDTTIRQSVQPFFTTKEPGRGTGLGLAMVEKFTRDESGALRIESRPGSGTTITLALPLATHPDNGSTVTENNTREHDPSPGSTGSNALRILVVDDEEFIVELAAEWLSGMGHLVKSASGASDALRMLDKEHFDVLFTDIVMPGDMDGLSLSREAVQRYPWLQVVLASGYSESLHDQSTALPGPLVTKPYRATDLVRVFGKPVDA